MKPYTELAEPTLESVRIHEGRIINLRIDTVRTPSGNVARREIIEHRGAVCLVPVLEDGRVVLVRQYRKPAEAALLELPAGGLEHGEEPAAAAHRELIEECGYDAARLTPLFATYLAPGYSNELVHTFLAEELRPTATNPDEDENVLIETYTLDELLPMLYDGRIRDAKTVSGLLALYHRRAAGL